MGILLEGKPVYEQICKEISEEARKLRDKNTEPTLLLIRIGNDSDDVLYEQNIVKAATEQGIKALSDSLPPDVTENELLKRIKYAADDDDIHGIMLLRSFPRDINKQTVSNAISPEKDVACVNDLNLLNVYNNQEGLYPCAALAAVALLDFYEIDLKGRSVVVIGRSRTVGKPLSMMLLNKNATVTICHSKTLNLRQMAKKADVVVSAVGSPKFLTKAYFTDKSKIIDLGMSYDSKSKKYCGDVDFDSVKDTAAAITPCMGGVEAVTTAMLLKNTIIACKNLKK